jgi:hypothetical protein
MIKQTAILSHICADDNRDGKLFFPGEILGAKTKMSH